MVLPIVQVLLKIEKVAICGSDIALYNWTEVAQVVLCTMYNFTGLAQVAVQYSRAGWHM